MQKSGRAAAQDVRGFFAATLGRVAAPVREVSWADFLLADFLTSLAKPLSDGERAVCHLLTGPVMDLSPRVRYTSGQRFWTARAQWDAAARRQSDQRPSVPFNPFPTRTISAEVR